MNLIPACDIKGQIVCHKFLALLLPNLSDNRKKFNLCREFMGRDTRSHLKSQERVCALTGFPLQTKSVSELFDPDDAPGSELVAFRRGMSLVILIIIQELEHNRCRKKGQPQYPAKRAEGAHGREYL